MLGIPFKLNGTLRHHILRGKEEAGRAGVGQHPSTSAVDGGAQHTPMKYSARLTRMLMISNVPKGQQRCKRFRGGEAF